MLREEGFEILDIDCVIAAQAPKLSPYREAMRENIARACGIVTENIGVKATTTERLGFEGREEGISLRPLLLSVDVVRAAMKRDGRIVQARLIVAPSN